MKNGGGGLYKYEGRTPINIKIREVGLRSCKHKRWRQGWGGGGLSGVAFRADVGIV